MTIKYSVKITWKGFVFFGRYFINSKFEVKKDEKQIMV